MKDNHKKNKTRRRLQALSGSKQMSFLPLPKYNPRWPNKNTFLHKALTLLLQGREITAIDFEDETSSQRLPAYIEKLCNKLGWPILREDASVKLKHKPRKRSFRKYYFDKEFIKTIKNIAGGAVW